MTDFLKSPSGTAGQTRFTISMAGDSLSSIRCVFLTCFYFRSILKLAQWLYSTPLVRPQASFSFGTFSNSTSHRNDNHEPKQSFASSRREYGVSSFSLVTRRPNSNDITPARTSRLVCQGSTSYYYETHECRVDRDVHVSGGPCMSSKDYTKHRKSSSASHPSTFGKAATEESH